MNHPNQPPQHCDQTEWQHLTMKALEIAKRLYPQCWGNGLTIIPIGLSIILMLLASLPMCAGLVDVGDAGILLLLLPFGGILVILILNSSLKTEIEETLTAVLGGSRSDTNILLISPQQGLAVRVNGTRIAICHRASDGHLDASALGGRDILRCEKLFDTFSKVESGSRPSAAGSLVGAAMFGIPGALALGWMTSTKSELKTDYVSNLRVRITTTDSHSYEFVFLEYSRNVRELADDSDFKKAEAFVALVEALIKQR